MRIHIKANAKGLQLCATSCARQCRHGAGVHTAGKQQPNRYISQQVHLHGFTQFFAQRFHRWQPARMQLRLACAQRRTPVLQFPIAREALRAISFYLQRMGRRQLPD